ncbi:MAG TPA: class I SAM-dependent methyltransferase, partial [Candidatus Wallbacteria bacterium]|nr:class I SAM-dependent methyltransferase [Candidatus Wallbacteria bacterium]
MSGNFNNSALNGAEIEKELSSGNRFKFGKNWSFFLKSLNDERIKSAENSLLSMLEISSLKGLSFLDAGSGSGLFSLAARKQGASVTSFDYDPQSVECTRELKRLYFDGDGDWKIEQGSVLDRDYLGGLGAFNIVYSWGVLHHTGDMWSALANMAPLVKPGGKLYIAIYNDQGPISKVWRTV